MKIIGQPERVTQNRVIALFRDELGYDYLGDWTDRSGNSKSEILAVPIYIPRVRGEWEQGLRNNGTGLRGRRRYQLAVSIVAHRLFDFLARIHDERSVLSDRLPYRASCQQ